MTKTAGYSNNIYQVEQRRQQFDKPFCSDPTLQQWML